MIVARGARAVEALVLAEIGALADEARRDPALLARPVFVVVPSRSLRLHLSARLVAVRGAVAGVEIVTLHKLAHDILTATDEPELPGAPLFPVLVQRAARREAALSAFLEPLADGYAGISSTVRDLLDAGLESAHADPLDERLAELGSRGEDAALARARAIVRAAAAVHTELELLGAGRSSTLLRRAADLVLEDAGRALPARAVIVHGFAEATGIATDLLEALVRRCGARVFVDEPPDPVTPDQPDLGAAFTRRLRDRLAGYAPEIDRTGLWRGRPARASGPEESAGKMPAPQEAEEGRAGKMPAPQAAGSLVLRRAPGTFAEARAVAADVRALLDGGARAESIGVVARDLGGVQLALRQHFGRLCIPYSTLGAPGLRGPASRRIEAVAALLAEGGAAPVDAWLDVAYGADGTTAGDLRLALRVLGATTAAEVAALPLADRLGDATALALPVRRGFEPVEDRDENDDKGEKDEATNGAEDERTLRPARRRVSAARLQRAVHAAGRWCRAWAALPARGAMSAHVAALRRLLDDVVRWRPDGDGADAVREALGKLVAELPARLDLEREEALELLGEELRDVGRVAPGGNGAGVQVLGVVDARGRTFEHLFVLGVNRDAFPRPVREDWLLPDRLRAALLPLLPDIPLKRTGHDEERYLFAQLLTAAPSVTVSWTECDDDGKPTPASPLVERLCDGDHDRVTLVRDVYAQGGVGDHSPRPAHEHAVLAGLFGSRERFAAVLPIALAMVPDCGAGILPARSAGEERGLEARTTPEPEVPCGAGILPALDAVTWCGRDARTTTELHGRGAAAATVAVARAAVLAELDPDRRTAEGRRRAVLPGPYFGFVGPAPAGVADPRAGDVWVTELEGIARCPWQTFLGRLLRLQPVPDAGADLPALSGALVGSVVHAALERIARGGAGDGPRTLAEVSAAAARAVPWPAEPELERILVAAAEEALREEGLALPLLVRSVAERARPFVDAAHLADFAAEGAVAVAGAEVEGGAMVTDGTGRPRRVAFRADRVDAVGGALRLTDYKTNKGLTTSAKEEQKRKRLLHFLGTGQWLQAAAYAASGGEVVAGRYLFLKPETADAARAIVANADRELLETFRAAVVDLLALRDAGAFFPRLVTPGGSKENPACGYCSFREACLVGDSGARRRLLAWAPGAGVREPTDSQTSAAGRVWRLGESDGGGETSGEGSA